MRKKFNVFILLFLLIPIISLGTPQKTLEIVFSGGPGSGKSTLLNYLHTYYGYVFLSETLTLLRDQARIDNTIDTFFDDQTQLHDDLIDVQKKREDSIKKDKELVLYDRSMYDILWYAKKFKSDHVDFLKEQARKNDYYRIVFICEALDKKYYDSNQGRFESYEESLEIGKGLCDIYKKNRYQLQKIPFNTIENRALFVIEKIKKFQQRRMSDSL